MSMDLNQRRAEIYGEPTLQGSLYDERQKAFAQGSVLRR